MKSLVKSLGLAAAALLGALSLAPASASAAPVAATLAVAGVSGQSVVVRERTVVRRDRQGYRGNRNRWGSRRVCTNRYRHGRQVRTCRTVRGRRY